MLFDGQRRQMKYYFDSAKVVSRSYISIAGKASDKHASRTVIIGWKWHQKLSKLWKGLPLNGFEPRIKKTINWEEAGVIPTVQNKQSEAVCVCGRGGGWESVWKRCRCAAISEQSCVITEWRRILLMFMTLATVLICNALFHK